MKLLIDMLGVLVYGVTALAAIVGGLWLWARWLERRVNR